MGLVDLNLTVQLIVFRVFALLLVAAVQGVAVAGAAVLMGDSGPRHDGRLSPSPARHLDVVGTIATVLFGLGWIRPLEVDAGALRPGRIGILAVVLAGSLGLLALAAVLAALVPPALTTLPYSAALSTAAFLQSAASLSIWFALFSLVPVPPLTGGLLLDAVGLRLPVRHRWLLAVVPLLLVATGVAREAFRPVHAVLAAFILGT